MASTCAQSNDGGYVYSGYNGDVIYESSDFRIFKFAPEVEIELQPWNPQLPADGGWLSYGAQVSNILVDATPLDAWLVLTNPNGDRFLQTSFPVTLQPGATFTRPRINVWIPPNAPNGTWTYEVHLGDASPVPPGGPGRSRNMGLGSFTFEKGDAMATESPSADSSPEWPNASTSWHPFTSQPLTAAGTDNAPSSAADKPPAEASLSASPNPFNTATTITLDLPVDDQVTLAIFTVQGRLVTTLADAERLTPGQHRFSFDASHLASGMYLVRASSTHGLNKTQKLMLVR